LPFPIFKSILQSFPHNADIEFSCFIEILLSILSDIFKTRAISLTTSEEMITK